MSRTKLDDDLRKINWWIHVLQGIDKLMQNDDYDTYNIGYQEQNAISQIAQHYGCNCIWSTYTRSWLESEARAQAHMIICKDIRHLQVLKYNVTITYGQPVSHDGIYAVYVVGSYKPHIPLLYCLDESQIDSIPYKMDRSASRKRNAIDYMIDMMARLQYEQVTVADIERSYNALVQAVADVKVDSGTGTGRAGEDKERALTGE